MCVSLPWGVLLVVCCCFSFSCSLSRAVSQVWCFGVVFLWVLVFLMVCSLEFLVLFSAGFLMFSAGGFISSWVWLQRSPFVVQGYFCPSWVRPSAAFDGCCFLHGLCWWAGGLPLGCG